MAARSTRVTLINKINSNFALVKTQDHLDHGVWTDRPPHFVGNTAQWGSESNGFLTGTEGWVKYEIVTQSLQSVLRLHLEWDNPFIGSNSYKASVEPVGRPDGSGFSVGYFGGGGDDAAVTFILLSGKCVVSDDGEVACTLHSALREGTQLYAAIWERKGGFSWQARHGLSSAQYQQAFNQLLSDGYRLVQVSGYNLNGEDRYAAIWEQRASVPWQARHGLSSAQYQQAFDELVGQGYRLSQVSGYSVGAEDRYAAIWEQGDDAPWQSRHGLSSVQYQETFNQLFNEGFRLVQVSGYSVNGEDRYAAIWEQREGAPWQARHGLSSVEYQRTFDQLLGEGYRLVQVSGYRVNGEDRYSAIWEQRAGVPWQARHGLTSAQYQEAFDELLKQGFRLVLVSGYA